MRRLVLIQVLLLTLCCGLLTAAGGVTARHAPTARAGHYTRTHSFFCAAALPFEKGSARLTGAAKAILDDLILRMASDDTLRVLIDTEPTDLEPERIKVARYRAVRRYIISRRFADAHEIEPARIAANRSGRRLCTSGDGELATSPVVVYAYPPSASLREYIQVCCDPSSPPN